MVFAGRGRTDARCAEALAQSLDQLGVETVFLGQERDAARIAAAVAAEGVDAVELCLAGSGGVSCCVTYCEN